MRADGWSALRQQEHLTAAYSEGRGQRRGAPLTGPLIKKIEKQDLGTVASTVRPHQVTTVRRREGDEIRRLIGCWLRLVDQAKAWDRDWLFVFEGFSNLLCDCHEYCTCNSFYSI